MVICITNIHLSNYAKLNIILFTKYESRGDQILLWAMGCFEVKKVEIHRPKSRGFNQFVLFFPNCRSHCSLLTFTSVGPDFTGATVTSCGMGAGGLTDCSLVEKGLRKSVEVVVIVGKCCENKNIESLCTAKFESLNSVFWHHDLPMFYP